jgi:hypothetical protein
VALGAAFPPARLARLSPAVRALVDGAEEVLSLRRALRRWHQAIAAVVREAETWPVRQPIRLDWRAGLAGSGYWITGRGTIVRRFGRPATSPIRDDGPARGGPLATQVGVLEDAWAAVGERIAALRDELNTGQVGPRLWQEGAGGPWYWRWAGGRRRLRYLGILMPPSLIATLDSPLARLVMEGETLLLRERRLRRALRLIQLPATEGPAIPPAAAVTLRASGWTARPAGSSARAVCCGPVAIVGRPEVVTGII